MRAPLAASLALALLAPLRARAEPGQRVAVMPFKALGRDAYGWIGAGVAETLTAALSAVPELRVVERSQLRAVQNELKLSDSDLAADDGAVKAGRLLSANRLVLGSFQVAGGEILINGRFMNTQTGVVVQGQTFQLRGRLDRLFDLYPKLTERVLGVLGVQVAGKTAEAVAAVQPASQSLQAQELYVQGREAFHERSLEGYRRAVALLQKATDEDPGYALAFAALAEAQAELGALTCAPLGLLRYDRRKEAPCHIPSHQPAQDELAQRLGYKDRAAAREKVEQEIERLGKECERWPKVALGNATTAASLLPALPAAHRALGLVYWHSGQRQKAEVEARTLLNLNRADAWGHYLLGLCSADAEESRNFHRRSLALDPRLGPNYYELAAWDYNEGKEAEALKLLDEAARLSPNDPEVHELRAELLARAGRDREALAAADEALRRAKDHARALFLRGLAQWRLGGPAHPWDRREAWQDAAALSIFRARLWEPKVCSWYQGTHPIEVWEVVLPERLRRGQPWKEMRKALSAIQSHVYDHDRDLKDSGGRCSKGGGRVIFLDTKDQREPVTEWVRGMLRKNAEPQVIDRWWADRSWNQFVFTVVACTSRPVTPDDEVRAELLFDGKPQPVFWPLGEDGRESDRWSDKQEGLVGAPARFTRPRTEFPIRGRFRFAELRRVLEDGSAHQVAVRVRVGGRVLAEGQVPFRLVDPSDLKE